MSTNQTTIREAENTVTIEGTVSEITIETKGEGDKQFITGEILIQTSEDSVHTVNVFANKYNKEGKESGIFKGIQTVMNDYKSIASVGKEEADKVRIETGKLSLNEYVGQDGEIKSYPQNTANFINRLKANEEFNPRAEFEVEIVVKSIKPEVKNDEETGRAKIEAIIPVYGGRVIEFPLVATNENGVAEFLLDNVEKGQTLFVYGEIVNRTVVTKREVGTGFGKPQEKIKSTTVREYLITGGNPPYDEDDVKAYKMEVIKKALVEREAYLEEKKTKKKELDKKPAATEKKSFGSKPNDTKKPINISDDDLPF